MKTKTDIRVGAILLFMLLAPAVSNAEFTGRQEIHLAGFLHQTQTLMR